MNIQVPTRTVSGTGSYNRNVVLQGRWQEHTNSSTIPVTGATSIQNITGTWEYSGSGTSANQFEVVAFPGTTPSMTIRPWTWRYTITANNYVKSATVADRGNLPSNVNARCQVSKNTIELIISGARAVTASPTNIEVRYTTYTKDMWQAVGAITFDPGYDNVEITDVTITKTGTTDVQPNASFIGNAIFMGWQSYTERTGSVTGQVRITYNYDTTTTTSYWTATDSYTLNDTGATITNATYVTGTQPSDVNYSGRTITLSWYSSAEPSGNVAGTTMRLTYSAPYSSTYANVYFNGTRVNYVYFNGTRYP